MICPWGNVNKTMFGRKTNDGAIPNLFLKTAKRATFCKFKNIKSLLGKCFQTLIWYKHVWLTSSSASADKCHQPKVAFCSKNALNVVNNLKNATRVILAMKYVQIEWTWYKLIQLDHAHMTIKWYAGHNTRRHAAVEQLDTGPRVIW